MSTTTASRSAPASEHNAAAAAFLGPTLLLLAAFTLLPIGFAVWGAFHQLDVISGHARFVGAANFGHLWDDEKFWAALRNTLRYVAIVVPAQTALALALACLLNGRIAFKRVFVTLLFLPTLTSSAAQTMIFMWLFNNNGLVTQWLNAQFAVTVRFLSDPSWTLGVVMLMNVFSTTPGYMIVFLAGLQSIPGTLYEAIALDGAGPWRRHWEISVPQLAPLIFYVVTMGLIGCFQVFDQVFIISGGEGGPEDSTLTLTLLVYHFAFKTYNTMGLACALALLLTLVIFAAAMAVRRVVGSEGAAR
jgi:ABC-type sugar transport system permease subunit